MSLEFLANDAPESEFVHGEHTFWTSTGGGVVTSLNRHMPSVEGIREVSPSYDEAVQQRQELEEAFLDFYFWRNIPPSPLTAGDRNLISLELGIHGGFSVENIAASLQRHQDGVLGDRIEQWEQLQAQRSSGDEVERPLQTPNTGEDSPSFQALEGRETVIDAESEHSWGVEDGETDGDNDASKQGQSLLNLLYRIAEEQARKEGYVHRSVTCNSCNTMPIRGIRYRCANCPDFDLCEQCEAMQIHDKTHLFYKIRIPAPFFRNPREAQPAWYPGRPVTVNYNLPKDTMSKLCKETGYQTPEIEALWEQFRCLAATEWQDDPGHYHLAIDRRTFDKCFVPNTSIRQPPPNLIYDRMFSYYDTNNDGLIGFDEFLKGLASLTKKNGDERWKRVFRGYDINNDGFVDRKDFLRMFRAYYALTKELTREIVAGMDDDISEGGARDIVLGSQPISSAFSGAIPPGERPRLIEGKVRNEYGDYVMNNTIPNNRGAVDESNDIVSHTSIIGESAEASMFGNAGSSTSERMIHHLIDQEVWPPPHVTLADAKTHLGDAIEGLEAVTDPKDQKCIRQLAHVRFAKDRLSRYLTRRRALGDRLRRRGFYIDEENGTELPKGFEPINAVDEAGSDRKKALEGILLSDVESRFRQRVLEELEHHRWCIEEPQEKLEKVLQLIKEEWPSDEIVEALITSGVPLADAVEFIMLICSGIEDFKDDAKREVNHSDSPVGSSAPSRRSRSSSKVRFQDDIGTDDEHELRSATSMSSRSIPVNERWGGFEVPEAEKDVGREVLYQVTQEALNELLDPVFKLREDLALAVLRTKRMRERYRSKISPAVENPRMIKRYLVVYQKQWRTIRQEQIPDGIFGEHEADRFFKFISQSEAGELNRLTGERCPRCTEYHFIGFGQYCEHCGQPSRQAMGAKEARHALPLELCPRCAEKGEETYIMAGYYCGGCGGSSRQAAEEATKLRRILDGGRQDTDNNSPEDSQAHGSSPPTLEQAIAQKPLEELLVEAGYTAAHSLRQQQSDPTILPQNRPNTEPRPDPTLPQNRPNTIREGKEPEKTDIPKASTPPSEALPDTNTLKFYAAMDILEAEDRERGGPGRLSFGEFEDLMKGEKGIGLGFLERWIEMATF